MLSYDDFSPDAVETMRLANYSAWKLNQDYIATEHILIGLCVNHRASTVELVAQAGIEAQMVLQLLKPLVKRGPSPVKKGRRPPTNHADDAVRHAVSTAESLAANSIENGHVLLGTEGTAAKTLSHLNVTYGGVFDNLSRM